MASRDVKHIRVSSLDVSPQNVRYGEPVEDLADLVASIQESGIQSPLLVRRAGRKYEVIAGARRLAAAEKAGLKTVPAIVVDYDDRQALAASYVENDQRSDMDPVTRAEALRKMLDAKVDGEPVFREAKDLAKALGRSKQSVSDLFALLRLDTETLEAVRQREVAYAPAVAIAYRYAPKPNESGDVAAAKRADQKKVVELVRGLRTVDQRRVLDALKANPALLGLSRQQVERNIDGLLSDFSEGERTRLRALYRRVKLDPDSIDWAKMTREKYERDLASKTRYLEKRKSKSIDFTPPPKKKAVEPEEKSSLEELPEHKELRELDEALSEIYDKIGQIDLVVKVGKKVVELTLADLGLPESERLMIQARLASAILEKES